MVAVAPARVRKHATLGPLEEWLGQQAGPGVVDGIAERAILRPEFVKGSGSGCWPGLS